MGKRLGITVIVLGLLLVVADRGGQFVVERIVAGQLQDQLRTSDEPDVDIAGIPFLPQLISRDFDKVTLAIRNADAGGVRVARIDARLRGVKQAGSGARVDSIAGDGLLTYDALTAAARPLQVSYGGDGLVKVAGSFAGIQATASARPRIVGNRMIIKPERIGSNITGDQAFGNLPTINVKLRDIPRNLDIEIRPGERGVAFTFTGRNVLFTSGTSASSAGPAFPVPAPVSRPVGARP